MKTPIIIVVFAAIVGIVAAAQEPAPPNLPENHHLKGQHRVIAAAGRHAAKTHGKRHPHATMATTEKVAVAAPPDGTDAAWKFEVEGHSKLCLAPGPCFKKKLVCPKKCSKLPGKGAAAASARRLAKNHFPGKCVFNCKKCIAHC